MIFYKLHCDGAGCKREIDSAIGTGQIAMPQGWSEFRGQVTISNGFNLPPTLREIVKHYCWDCRERMREHGVAPSETVVMAHDRLESPDMLPICPRCGHQWQRRRAAWTACPICGCVPETNSRGSEAVRGG